ncbi:hypothetical protein CLF_108894 [Clonorchis sinensis]|uniref:Uncharacterized protein n=1 Tax=Clonorchis sinensis TaxID=79923 RepID=G7YIR2_CLOSI|nr:hypothetical protein CLF_108894 [Clonorchis sinensis]
MVKVMAPTLSKTVELNSFEHPVGVRRRYPGTFSNPTQHKPNVRPSDSWAVRLRDDTKPYTQLQNAIITRTSLSEHERLEQLISGETFDGCTPSEFLRRLYGILGDRKIDDALIKQLFLKRLPTHVQSILAPDTDKVPLTQLANIPDRILENCPRSVAATNGVDPQATADLLRSILRLQESFVASLRQYPIFEPGSDDGELDGAIGGDSDTDLTAEDAETAALSRCRYRRVQPSLATTPEDATSSPVSVDSGGIPIKRIRLPRLYQFLCCGGILRDDGYPNRFLERKQRSSLWIRTENCGSYGIRLRASNYGTFREVPENVLASKYKLNDVLVVSVWFFITLTKFRLALPYSVCGTSLIVLYSYSSGSSKFSIIRCSLQYICRRKRLLHLLVLAIIRVRSSSELK